MMLLRNDVMLRIMMLLCNDVMFANHICEVTSFPKETSLLKITSFAKQTSFKKPLLPLAKGVFVGGRYRTRTYDLPHVKRML